MKKMIKGNGDQEAIKKKQSNLFIQEPQPSVGEVHMDAKLL